MVKQFTTRLLHAQKMPTGFGAKRESMNIERKDADECSVRRWSPRLRAGRNMQTRPSEHESRDATFKPLQFRVVYITGFPEDHVYSGGLTWNHTQVEPQSNLGLRKPSGVIVSVGSIYTKLNKTSASELFAYRANCWKEEAYSPHSTILRLVYSRLSPCLCAGVGHAFHVVSRAQESDK